MHRPETWLEPALARSLEGALSRVEAPRELLDRVLYPVAPEPDGSRAWWIWAPAAALLILVIALALSLRAGPVSQEPKQLALVSGEPSRIRAWIQETAALNIPLPGRTPVQLLGANAQGGAAEIVYRVENRDAMLLVSKAQAGFPADRRHHFLTGVLPGERSWIMSGQLYTLAFADTADFKSACRLCHLN